MTNTNDIIKNNHYPAYVLASAGTGKTELIARKVENLVIDEGVDIDKIALITFTNKATSETLSRIKSKIYSAWENGNTSIRNQIDKLRLAKISTIHIFCDNPSLCTKNGCKFVQLYGSKNLLFPLLSFIIIDNQGRFATDSIRSCNPTYALFINVFM